MRRGAAWSRWGCGMSTSKKELKKAFDLLCSVLDDIRPELSDSGQFRLTTTLDELSWLLFERTRGEKKKLSKRKTILYYIGECLGFRIAMMINKPDHPHPWKLSKGKQREFENITEQLLVKFVTEYVNNG